ncbi:MAG: hypothetical protein GY953_01585, partial [bacterium]|nr:hypothetical protein [bacterium]
PGKDWGRHSLALEVDRTGIPKGAPLLIRIELLTPGTVSLDQVFLFPEDNLDGFDPDIVSMLKESRLPLLRFPGGNFVSGYHWEDGIGDVNSRPTRTNPAWGGFEPNHVGADEYMKLCQRIGAEPLICVNAGNGTAREAANWVEYLNGSTETKYGALRASNGHPEPYNIKLWEIGNELYGKWQVGYCTPEEYAARYAAFHKAMSAVDPTIRFQAIGQSEEWIAPLLRSSPGIVETLAIHELPGGGTPADAPPDEVFEELMANIETFRAKLLGLAARMRDAGLTPKLAITEAQIFTNKRTLPTNDSLA